MLFVVINVQFYMFQFQRRVQFTPYFWLLFWSFYNQLTWQCGCWFFHVFFSFLRDLVDTLKLLPEFEEGLQPTWCGTPLRVSGISESGSVRQIVYRLYVKLRSRFSLHNLGHLSPQHRHCTCSFASMELQVLPAPAICQSRSQLLICLWVQLYHNVIGVG